jgi:ketosteroid isomerase-like protein
MLFMALVLAVLGLQAATALELEIAAFQKELFDAMAGRDRAVLERLIAADFVFIHSTGGVDSRQPFIDKAVAGTQSSQTASPEYTDRQVRVFGGHTAIRISRSVRDKGSPSELNLRTLHVYAKGPKGWQWLSGQSTALSSRPKGVTIDTRVYRDYVGVYPINEARTLTVTREGDGLRARTDRSNAELVPQSATEFAWFDPDTNLDAQLVFVRDASGRVTHALFMRGGREMWRGTKR